MSDDVTKKVVPHPAWRRLPQWFEDIVKSGEVGLDIEATESHEEIEGEKGTKVIDKFSLKHISFVPRQVGPVAQQEKKPL